MAGSFLPGLRHLRIPLSSGATWLVVVWLAWGRHLEPVGAFADLVADSNTAATWLGTGVTLGVLAFAAYAVGELWVNTQWEVVALASRAMRRYAPGLGDRAAGMRWWPNSDRQVVTSILSPHGALPDFLPHLGAHQVEPSSVSKSQVDGVLTALDHDLWRCSLVLPQSAPALAEEVDRWRMQARFAKAMAIPLGAGAIALGTAIWPGWGGAAAGVGVALVGVYVLAHVTAEFTAEANILLLAAIDLGYAEAPSVTAYCLKQWGPEPVL